MASVEEPEVPADIMCTMDDIVEELKCPLEESRNMREVLTAGLSTTDALIASLEAMLSKPTAMLPISGPSSSIDMKPSSPVGPLEGANSGSLPNSPAHVPNSPALAPKPPVMAPPPQPPVRRVPARRASVIMFGFAEPAPQDSDAPKHHASRSSQTSSMLNAHRTPQRAASSSNLGLTSGETAPLRGPVPRQPSFTSLGMETAPLRSPLPRQPSFTSQASRRSSLLCSAMYAAAQALICDEDDQEDEDELGVGYNSGPLSNPRLTESGPLVRWGMTPPPVLHKRASAGAPPDLGVEARAQSFSNGFSNSGNGSLMPSMRRVVQATKSFGAVGLRAASCSNLLLPANTGTTSIIKSGDLQTAPPHRPSEVAMRLSSRPSDSNGGTASPRRDLSRASMGMSLTRTSMGPALSSSPGKAAGFAAPGSVVSGSLSKLMPTK